MKKLVSLFLTALTVCVLTVSAFAAEAAPPVLYPVEITEYTQGDSPRLEKVYALSAAADPTAIPTADFTREGRTYTLLDVTRQDETATESKAHTEAVTMESTSRDMDKILPLLTTTKEITTGDGYTGILTLDTASIKVEAAGYATASRTVTATRSYPNLSDADAAFVPKTTEDNGRTLTLADVQWQEAGGFYHATATYTGAASSKYATGYTVTANYSGEVSKTTGGKVIYTAVFGVASEANAPAETAGPAHSGGGVWKWLLILPVGACGLGLAYLGVFLNKKYKAKKGWREYTK